MEQPFHRDGTFTVEAGPEDEESVLECVVVPYGRPGHYRIDISATFGGSEPQPGSTGLTLGSLAVFRDIPPDAEAMFVPAYTNVCEIQYNKPHTLREPSDLVWYSHTNDNSRLTAEVDLQPLEQLRLVRRLAPPNTIPGNWTGYYSFDVLRTGD